MKAAATFLRNFPRGVGIATALLIATTSDAHAYVDPGTGAMILQIIGAIVAGTLFYFRQLRAKVSEWFARLTGRERPKDDQA
jgi:hypothetical protein